MSPMERALPRPCAWPSLCALYVFVCVFYEAMS
jgi:hypothetical protein